MRQKEKGKCVHSSRTQADAGDANTDAAAGRREYIESQFLTRRPEGIPRRRLLAKGIQFTLVLPRPIHLQERVNSEY